MFYLYIILTVQTVVYPVNFLQAATTFNGKDHVKHHSVPRTSYLLSMAILRTQQLLLLFFLYGRDVIAW